MKSFALILTAALVGVGAANAQTPLTAYADAQGDIDVQKLTCAQLAGTFQEDADFLAVWYSGWFNGHLKRHSINPARVKTGLHEVIVFCKANPETTVVDAVETLVKKMQGGQ